MFGVTVVLVCRAGDVVVVTVDDADEAVHLAAFVCAGLTWPPSNVSSLRYFGRGGTAGFGPVRAGFDSDGVCLAASSAAEDNGVGGTSAVPSGSSAALGRIPTSKILTCVLSTTTRRPSAAKSSA